MIKIIVAIQGSAKHNAATWMWFNFDMWLFISFIAIKKKVP